MRFLLVAAIFCIGCFALANERYLPAPLLIKMGYNSFQSFHHYVGSRRAAENIPHNLPWPVQFQDSAHDIDQNYVNFQDYGPAPYFHKGCDLRALAGSWVTATVTGV